MAYIEVNFSELIAIKTEEIFSIDGLKVSFAPERQDKENAYYYSRQGKRAYELLTIKRKIQAIRADPRAFWSWFDKGEKATITVTVKDNVAGVDKAHVVQTIELKEVIPIEWYVEYLKDEKHVLECIVVAPGYIEVLNEAKS